MATIFKRKGKGPYIIQWFDHEGRRREKSSRTTDKRVAERIAAKLEGDTALRRDGVIDAAVDEYARHARRPLHEHIADFRKSLASKRSEDYVDLTLNRIERVIRESGITTWDCLTPDRIERALVKIKDAEALDPLTRNYLSDHCNDILQLDGEAKARESQPYRVSGSVGRARFRVSSIA